MPQSHHSRLFQERPQWVASLLGSGLFLVFAAGSEAASIANHPAFYEAVSVAFAGVASFFANRWNTRWQEDQDKKDAERNHQVRLGMAEALQSALKRAETELKEYLPSDLREQIFANWLLGLKQAQSDSDCLDRLFPIGQSDMDWRAATRYDRRFDQEWLAAQSRETLQRIRANEDEDCQALAMLLLNFPAHPSEGTSQQMFVNPHWGEEEARNFAEKLLPLYRTAFACVFSAGGLKSNAIGYKGMVLQQSKLDELQSDIQSRLISLDKKMDKVIGILIRRTVEVVAPGYTYVYRRSKRYMGAKSRRRRQEISG